MLKASKAREESSDPPVKDQNENDIGLLNSSRSQKSNKQCLKNPKATLFATENLSPNNLAIKYEGK